MDAAKTHARAVMCLWLPLAGALALQSAAVANDEIDFHRDIRPILSNNCFRCHGPDAEVREADLRLDRREDAFALRDETAIVLAGDPEASLLYQRISARDEEDRMPPPHSEQQLTPDQVESIRRWIQLGAPWREHWSFIPPRRTKAPDIEEASWPRDPIDEHVLARLESEGLSPEREADRVTLLRRITFDLTGLPPTLEEIDAFLADDRPGAYERVVDRLLASPRFGEHVATSWLDLARYADTYGYQSDVDRAVWPYRDWVIGAFNENLPYDAFLTWQLAGDLLPDPTREQRIATAFNRLHRQTNEGGSVEEEFRVEYVADRVHTFGTAILGLTTECARCHDHKFDPISQREYYQLCAFFDEIEESGLYSHFTAAVPTPTLLLTTPLHDEQIADLRSRIAAAEKELARVRTTRASGFQAWLATAPAELAIPDQVGDYPLDAPDAEGLRNRADEAKPASVSGAPSRIEGMHDGALLLSGENNVHFPGVAEFSRTDPFTIALWVKIPERFDRSVILHRTRSWTDAGSQGYELLVADGHLRWSLIHFWPGNAISIQTHAPIVTDSWMHVTLTYDGSMRADGLGLFIDGVPSGIDVLHDNLYKPITGGGPGAMTIGQRFRDRGFKGGAVDELCIFTRELTPIEVRDLHDGAAIAKAREASPDDLLPYYLDNHDQEVAARLESLIALRRELAAVLNSVPEIMAMEQRARPRSTYRLQRGRYDDRREEVVAQTPATLMPMAADLGRDRLGLAQWATDPGHPLTARVAVNHFWMVLLGRGLVGTPEDFGSQGVTPTHPELLDMLALDFIDSGWDVKALLRRIATSATYRQSSRVTLEQRGADPENELLSRGPGRRLSAEMMRDHVLASSGLLVQKLGGPSVYPYQPKGLWQEKSGKVYPQGTGESLHRRSLYTFWKRTSPPPSMLIFDATKRDVCVARRASTSTPLQALVLLNDPQFVEAARVLAERATVEAPTIEDRITLAYRLLASRRPNERELAVLLELYERELNEFNSDEAAAAALAAAGSAPTRENLAPGELAALTIVCSAIMNSDAAVTRR